MSQENPPVKEQEEAPQSKPSQQGKDTKEVSGHSRSGWWTLLRIVIIIVVLILVFFGGAVAGFVILGKQDLSHVWDINTWKHVYDLVFA